MTNCHFLKIELIHLNMRDNLATLKRTEKHGEGERQRPRRARARAHPPAASLLHKRGASLRKMLQNRFSSPRFYGETCCALSSSQPIREPQLITYNSFFGLNQPLSWTPGK